MGLQCPTDAQEMASSCRSHCAPHSARKPLSNNSFEDMVYSISLHMLGSQKSLLEPSMAGAGSLQCVPPWLGILTGWDSRCSAAVPEPEISVMERPPQHFLYISNGLTGGCSSQPVSSRVSSFKMLCNLAFLKSLTIWFVG